MGNYNTQRKLNPVDRTVRGDWVPSLWLGSDHGESFMFSHLLLTVILRPQLLFNIRKPFLIMRSYQTLRKGASTCSFFLDKYTSTHSPYYANQNCTQYSPSGPTKDALMFPIFILLFISMPLECCLASPISARPSVDNWLFHQTFTEHRPYKITAQRRNRPFGL